MHASASVDALASPSVVHVHVDDRDVRASR